MTEARQEPNVYAEPRVVSGPEECDFYHTIELPGHGVVEGAWDLRGGEDAYLGGVELAGKRVLEIGSASGFMSFHMERRGADVVAYDLSPAQTYELVPYARARHGDDLTATARRHLERTNNAFWLGHRLTESRARLAHGTVYEIPAALGLFDVATLGSVLLHLRDPFRALEQALSRTRETAVITDRTQSLLLRLPFRASAQLGRAMLFRPDAATCQPEATWWRLNPHLIKRMVAVLGFEDARVTYHRQVYEKKKTPLFTVVARRTQPMRDGGATE
jgi:SAM-dependent methyltransferase